MKPIQLELKAPKKNNNYIKVIGVGGAGGNALNYMHKQGIHGVDYIICNTDSQALDNSEITTKIRLGTFLEGLGAGTDPEKGEKAAIESSEEIEKLLDHNTKMVFITAGMGKGTGTGGAPVIAKICKDKGILTVGIVTTPFSYEGDRKNKAAQKGIEKLRQHVDSMIVINNDKLFEAYGEMGVIRSFEKADEVLTLATKSIAEVITKRYHVNLDMNDLITVLKDSGTAIMGTAEGEGKNCAMDLLKQALDSPLLNDNKIVGAKNVLLIIAYGEDEVTNVEFQQLTDYIKKESNRAEVHTGLMQDKSMGKKVIVTAIASGFNHNYQKEITNSEKEDVIFMLEDDYQTPIKKELDTSTKFTDITFRNQIQKRKNLQKETEPEMVLESSQTNSYSYYPPQQEPTFEKKDNPSFDLDEIELIYDNSENSVIHEESDLSHNAFDKEEGGEIHIEKTPPEAPKQSQPLVENFEQYTQIEQQLTQASAPIEIEELPKQPAPAPQQNNTQPSVSFNQKTLNTLKAQAPKRMNSFREFNHNFSKENLNEKAQNFLERYKRSISAQPKLSNKTIGFDPEGMPFTRKGSYLHDNVD